MTKKVLTALWLSCLIALPAMAADFALRPNTAMIGQPGLLTMPEIGLNAAQGRATTLALEDATTPKGQEALIAQALLLYLPRYTRFLPNPTPPYLAKLGAPTNQVPEGKKPAPLFIQYGERLLNVGDASRSHLGLPIDGRRVKKSTRPTGLFIAHSRAAKDLSKGLRFDTVLGRTYENGLVLFRANMYAQNHNYHDAHLLTVPLPTPLRRMELDGTLGPTLTQIDLGGFEGAILINAE